MIAYGNATLFEEFFVDLSRIPVAWCIPDDWRSGTQIVRLEYAFVEGSSISCSVIFIVFTSGPFSPHPLNVKSLHLHLYPLSDESCSQVWTSLQVFLRQGSDVEVEFQLSAKLDPTSPFVGFKLSTEMIPKSDGPWIHDLKNNQSWIQSCLNSTFPSSNVSHHVSAV